MKKTDKEYLSWLRTQRCCICGRRPAEAAHVRRINKGAGTGIKPPFNAIPLCHECHSKQHQFGESSLFPCDRDWKQRMEVLAKDHLHRWSNDVLNEEF